MSDCYTFDEPVRAIPPETRKRMEAYKAALFAWIENEQEGPRPNTDDFDVSLTDFAVGELGDVEHRAWCRPDDPRVTSWLWWDPEKLDRRLWHQALRQTAQEDPWEAVCARTVHTGPHLYDRACAIYRQRGGQLKPRIRVRSHYSAREAA